MTNREIIRSRRTGLADEPDVDKPPLRASGEVVRGVDFRSKRRERIYDPDKIWSGEHTMRDYTEL